MSRILLLLPFMIWMAASDAPRHSGIQSVWQIEKINLFFCVFIGIIIATGMYSRMLARRLGGGNLTRSLQRFNRVVSIARMGIPVWFAFGVFALGWDQVAREMISQAWISIVRHPVGPVEDWPIQLPLILLGTLPAFVAWMGLWWSQYPADRALREQSLLIQLENDVPIQSPPHFWSYFTANVRMQLLFTVVPILLVILARDLFAGAFWLAGRSVHESAKFEGVMVLISLATVFILAPEILRRVLHTQSLPDSPLRRKLEWMCISYGLKYRDILVWRTQNNVGNAAVMGIIPQMRYVLLSDLLLETMTDEQIEAVFAHELGHIVHRHMAWYVVFFMTLMCLLAGPGESVSKYFNAVSLPAWLPETLVAPSIGMALFVFSFGLLSRRFERQADVFAARTMEKSRSGNPPENTGGNAHVGPYGASIFASTLYRVAVINNIPISARNWSHGSIEKRMRYLQSISQSPAHTLEFDRWMTRLYVGLLIALSTFGVWAVTILLMEIRRGS